MGGYNKNFKRNQVRIASHNILARYVFLPTLISNFKPAVHGLKPHQNRKVSSILDFSHQNDNKYPLLKQSSSLNEISYG